MDKQTVTIKWKLFSIKHGTRDECNSMDESQPKHVLNERSQKKKEDLLLA